jgi:4-hydroxybenzoate polyprenyltransferase
MTTSQSPFQHYAHIVRHFISTRATEVLVLQASPLLGYYLGGFGFEQIDILRLGLLLLGSLALTAHVFVFNDWAGYASDIQDPQRVAFVFARQGISRAEVAGGALVLLIFANIALAIIGLQTMLLGSAIAVLGILYSSFGKSRPILGSINHLLGGALHFLLGYTVSHTLDVSGLMISLFFGLVFAGGHLNQEVRDYEGDLLNGIRTSAVTFGRRHVFFASLCIFTVAYVIVCSLAAVGVLSDLLLWSPIIWLLHVTWSLGALRRGLGFETAVWMQWRYRLLFALIGLAMLVR